MENFSSDSKTLKDPLEQEMLIIAVMLLLVFNSRLNVENGEKLIKYIPKQHYLCGSSKGLQVCFP